MNADRGCMLLWKNNLNFSKFTVIFTITFMRNKETVYEENC